MMSIRTERKRSNKFLFVGLLVSAGLFSGAVALHAHAECNFGCHTMDRFYEYDTTKCWGRDGGAQLAWRAWNTGAGNDDWPYYDFQDELQEYTGCVVPCWGSKGTKSWANSSFGTATGDPTPNKVWLYSFCQ